MNKSERITVFMETMRPLDGVDPHYAAYFQCFNEGNYYEAHDVLEQLWLRQTGQDALFFKALIQVAGAFVHMQKQYVAPTHPKHGLRLRPAARLFRLSAANLKAFHPEHLHLDVDSLCSLCLNLATFIEDSGYARNPWNPESKPQLNVNAERR